MMNRVDEQGRIGSLGQKTQFYKAQNLHTDGYDLSLRVVNSISYGFCCHYCPVTWQS